jgi:hypothetical protein
LIEVLASPEKVVCPDNNCDPRMEVSDFSVIKLLSNENDNEIREKLKNFALRSFAEQSTFL